MSGRSSDCKDLVADADKLLETLKLDEVTSSGCELDPVDVDAGIVFGDWVVVFELGVVCVEAVSIVVLGTDVTVTIMLVEDERVVEALRARTTLVPMRSSATAGMDKNGVPLWKPG